MSAIYKFNLSKNAHTSLRIFDVAGNFVSELISDQLIPGSYIAKFNGSNFASGIYYYTLVSGKLTETKKMILLK